MIGNADAVQCLRKDSSATPQNAENAHCWLAERGGTQLKTPRATLVVDPREQNPFDFSQFEDWFAGIENKALKVGDYSLFGQEDLCVVERKDLPDLVHSFTVERASVC